MVAKGEDPFLLGQKAYFRGRALKLQECSGTIDPTPHISNEQSILIVCLVCRIYKGIILPS